LKKGRNIEKIISEILSDLDNETKKDLDTKTKRMLQFLACKAAVKAGDPLTTEQSKAIIEQLEKTPNNLTCPHGRPTKITVTLKELATSFKR
jgi:DNA mismatch repair protein MutL